MISDVLSDAIHDIEDYQRDIPDAYGEFTDEIAVVKTVMDGLRMVFDAAPGLGDEHDNVIAELRAAIRGLNVSGLLAAQDRLLAWVAEERKRLKKEKGA